jgi:isopentenyl-diphosphate delta-isomerase
VGEGLIEHEFDHVWIGQSDDIPQINRNEVESWKYMSLNDLKNDIEAHPEHYTEWFKITFEEMTHHAAVFQ